MGPRPQSYIPSYNVIGPLVLEKKIFEGFLPYMGMVVILVMWPRPRKQTFVPQTHGCSTWNLALIGQVVLEKISENDGLRMTDHGYTISSSMSLKAELGSVELKILKLHLLSTSSSVTSFLFRKISRMLTNAIPTSSQSASWSSSGGSLTSVKRILGLHKNMIRYLGCSQMPDLRLHSLRPDHPQEAHWPVWNRS